MPPTTDQIVCIFSRVRLRWDETVLAEAELVPSLSSTPNDVSPLDFDSSSFADDFSSSSLTITLKGPSPLDDLSLPPDERPDPSSLLQPGLTYRLDGRWVVHPKYGRQFHFRHFARVQPHGRDGTIRYLQSVAEVTNRTATVLWERFGGDSVRLLREDPEAAAAVVGRWFPSQKARAAAEKLRLNLASEEAERELLDLIGSRGFPGTLKSMLMNDYGISAARVVREDPYVLLRYPGCGFLRADQLYTDLGHDPRAIRRQSLAAWYKIESDTNGHTWFPVEYAVSGIVEKIGGADVDGPAAMHHGKSSKLLAFRKDGDGSGRLWVADSQNAGHERRIAERVAGLLCISQGESNGHVNSSLWPSVDTSHGLSDHQAAELSKATTGRIGLFTGGGGTGKTFSIARLTASVLDEFGADEIALCAPTWAAANRMTESLAEYGIEHEATSIHSLLGVASREGGKWQFQHDRDNPLPHTFVIADETSMCDAVISASLFDAISPRSHLLLVGDTAQLSPVGHGAPMRDILSAGAPHGNLTQIRRNAGTLVRALSLIREGRPFPVDERVDLTAESPKNFRWLETGDPARQIEYLLKVFRCARQEGRNITWDVKVIVAVNDRGPLCRVKLNEILQRELNSQGASQRAGNNPFLPGDPIVKRGKRQSFKVDMERQRGIPFKADGWSGGGIGDGGDGRAVVSVTNREQAEVVAVEERLIVAKLMRGRKPVYIRIPRGSGGGGGGGGGAGKNSQGGGESSSRGDRESDKDTPSVNTGCEWELCYAMTCHIGQGGQWPVVAVMIDDYPGARMLCDRSWLYTGASRATKLCVAIGKRESALWMLRRNKVDQRKTFLVERIREEVRKLEGGRLSRAEIAAAVSEAIEPAFESLLPQGSDNDIPF